MLRKLFFQHLLKPNQLRPGISITIKLLNLLRTILGGGRSVLGQGHFLKL